MISKPFYPAFLCTSVYFSCRRAITSKTARVTRKYHGNQLKDCDADQFENDDKYLLHVNNLIREHIGLEYAGFIRFQLVPVDSKKVLLIECQPSPSPVFLKIGKDEDFYVRIGPGSRKLSTSEVLAYVANRKTKL